MYFLSLCPPVASWFCQFKSRAPFIMVNLCLTFSQQELMTTRTNSGSKSSVCNVIVKVSALRFLTFQPVRTEKTLQNLNLIYILRNLLTIAGKFKSVLEAGNMITKFLPSQSLFCGEWVVTLMFASFSATVPKQPRFSMIQLGGRTWRQASSAYRRWLMDVVPTFNHLWMMSCWNLSSQL